MTYRGTIKNGVAILDASTPLPEGTRVRIEIESADAKFFQRKTVEELAADQNVVPTESLDELALDWPTDESIDELMHVVREARR